MKVKGQRYYAIGTRPDGSEYPGTDHFLSLDGRYGYATAVNVSNNVLLREHGLTGYNLYRGSSVSTVTSVTQVRQKKEPTI